MALHLIDKRSRTRVRMLSLGEEDVLRAAKEGRGDDPEAVEAYLELVRAAHGRGWWIECDCRREGPARPVVVPRRIGRRRFLLVNLPNAAVPHAERCVFRRGEVREPDEGGRPPASGHADVLDPFPDEEERPGARPDRHWRPTGLSAGQQPKTMTQVLRKLTQTARLNTLSGADRFSSAAEWLAQLRLAADRLYLPPRVPASGFLFTDPESWRNGEVEACLAAAEPGWPEGHRPLGFLCWPAFDVGEYDINPENREAGYVEASAPVASPTVGRNRVSGPYLFLGAVARSGDRQRWECARACAQPIFAAHCPIPVDSHSERRALGALRELVRNLNDDRAQREALGGAVRAELEKPLTRIEVHGGACLPDFLLTVTRAGAYSHLPGGPGHPRHVGRFDPRDTVRYVVEIMGFEDPEYRRRKARTHPRMHQLGTVFRMEAREFDARGKGLEHQRDRIAREIKEDLLRRWQAR